jgi:hypothetical protein
MIACERPFFGWGGLKICGRGVLQLMCRVYVGFKDINPALDTGMDLAEPYETALKMYES